MEDVSNNDRASFSSWGLKKKGIISTMEGSKGEKMGAHGMIDKMRAMNRKQIKYIQKEREKERSESKTQGVIHKSNIRVITIIPISSNRQIAYFQASRLPLCGLE